MSTIKVQNIQHTGSSTNAIALASDGTCTANITNNLSNRNKIINGSMAVSQRQTSRTGTGGGDGYFLCDRWRIFSSDTSARFTISQASDTSNTVGLPNSFKFDCTTADTSLAANDTLGIQQRIEGQNLQDFLKGTSSAKKFTLSFYVKTNKSGVYTVELRDVDNNRHCCKTFTVSDANLNRYTLSFPADTTGVFNNDNGDSLRVNFWLIAGSNYTSGTLNTSGWATRTDANRVSSSNVNIGDSTDNNFELTGVQLEVDQTGSGVATDYEQRSFGQELQLCARYYQKIVDGNAKAVATAFGYNTTYADFVIQYPMGAMRSLPSLDQENGNDYYSYYNSSQGGINLDGAFIIEHGEVTQANVYFDPDAAVNPGEAGYLRTGNASAYLALSAEL